MTSAVVSYLVSRAWAMEPQELRARASAIAVALEKVPADTLRLAQERAALPGQATGDRKHYQVRDGVAHIPIAGVMLKEVPCLFEMFGMQACGTADTREAFEAAVMDDDVASIVLDIDSPGGSVAGVQELADAVYAARGLKPVTAKVSDLCASAAYWVASQADSIVANESAMVGSIGVYSVMEDASAAYASHGVKVHVMRSHELKGAGVEGDTLTAAQLADSQRIVDGWAEMFIAAVARGRGIDPASAREAATGQVWFAGQARDRKLIDGITGSARATSEKSNAPRAAQETTMAQETKPDVAADLAKAQAQLAAMREQMAAVSAQRRDDLIASHRDRVSPSALESVKKVGDTYGDDLAGFEAFIKGLPAVTRAERLSSVADVEKAAKAIKAGAGSLAAITGVDPFTRADVGGQEGAEQVARLLGTSVDAIDRWSDVEFGYSNGTFKMKDGRILTTAELKKLKAA